MHYVTGDMPNGHTTLYTPTATLVLNGADLTVGHALPLTVSVGVARGFAERGETRAYFRTGLAF